jgi:hypothetical protein
MNQYIAKKRDKKLVLMVSGIPVTIKDNYEFFDFLEWWKDSCYTMMQAVDRELISKSTIKYDE